MSDTQTFSPLQHHHRSGFCKEMMPQQIYLYLAVMRSGAQPMPIPFGVGGFIAIRRHRVNAPVYEDAKLGLTIPFRRWTRIEGFPVGLVSGFGEKFLKQNQQQGQGNQIE